MTTPNNSIYSNPTKPANSQVPMNSQKGKVDEPRDKNKSQQDSNTKHASEDIKSRDSKTAGQSPQRPQDKHDSTVHAKKDPSSK